MTLNEVERTWIHQFNKPENRKVLEEFKTRKDKSFEEFRRYYKFIITTLEDTPAWGVSGVNKMVNDLTAAVIATLTKAKTGKTSAYAHAGTLLNKIDHFSNQKAEPRYCGRYKLGHIITDLEFDQMLATTAI